MKPPKGRNRRDPRLPIPPRRPTESFYVLCYTHDRFKTGIQLRRLRRDSSRSESPPRAIRPFAFSCTFRTSCPRREPPAAAEQRCSREEALQDREGPLETAGPAESVPERFEKARPSHAFSLASSPSASLARPSSWPHVTLVASADALAPVKPAAAEEHAVPEAHESEAAELEIAAGAGRVAAFAAAGPAPVVVAEDLAADDTVVDVVEVDIHCWSIQTDSSS